MIRATCWAIVENEIYVILWDKKAGYDYYAVAASKNVHWAEARLKSLPANLRNEFRIRPVTVEGVDHDLVVFYDRWAPNGPCSLSGFGIDPKLKPFMPMEPEERLTADLELDVAPESIFGAKEKKKAAVKAAPRRKAMPETPQPRPLRAFLVLGGALALWLLILGVLAAAIQMRPVTLRMASVLPEGWRFPISYQDPVWVSQGGWQYFEAEVSTAAFNRLHEGVAPWVVIASDENITVVRPQVFDVTSHERAQFSFVTGLGEGEQWRKDNFLIVREGYIASWRDGSQLVFDLTSKRIYGKVSRKVASELFGG